MVAEQWFSHFTTCVPFGICKKFTQSNDSSNDEEEQFVFVIRIAKHVKKAVNEHRKNVEELLKNRKTRNFVVKLVQERKC